MYTVWQIRITMSSYFYVKLSPCVCGCVVCSMYVPVYTHSTSEYAPTMGYIGVCGVQLYL